MAQVNGSHFKLVYSHWYEKEGKSFPISNGLHPAVVNWIKTIDHSEMIARHHRIDQLDDIFQQPNSGLLFRHSNFIWHFLEDPRFSLEDLIKDDDVIDDGTIYLFPIEYELSGLDFLSREVSFVVNGTRIKRCTFKDTLSPKMLSLLQQGKVKILLTNIIDPFNSSLLPYDFEKVINELGIDSKNLIILQGNIPNRFYNNLFHSNIIFMSGFISLFQAAELMEKFPIFSEEMGYISDNVKDADFNLLELRKHRFLCFNRSMNRLHRLAICYLALKYNLLEDNLFSFVTNLTIDVESTLAEYYSDDPNLPRISNQIRDLIPHELDTQHLSDDQKQSFQNISVSKKSYYLDSYIHITSETDFDANLDPFFSEKTWRPIINLQPFIYIGNPGALQKLHELGFKTFSPFIDESYDQETNPKKRIKMIEAEIKKLSSMPIQEIHDWYYSITDTLMHNQRKILEYRNYNPYEQLFDIKNYEHNK